VFTNRHSRYSIALCLGLVIAALAGGAASARSLHQERTSPLAGKRFDRRVDLLFATGGYADGTIVRAYKGRVHQLGHLRYPAWNPIASDDGRWIEFGAHTPGSSNIGVMHADGRHARIIPHTLNCYPGGWGPNASWIAAGCGTFVPGGDVNLVELDPKTGSVVRHVGTIPPGESPSVSRTTGAIAYCDLDGSVYTVDPATGTRLKIATEKEGSSAPAWSPDGRKLSFFSQSGAGGEIETVNADGSGQKAIRRIRTWQADFALTYSANGRWIVYGGSSDRTHDLYLIGADGKTRTRLTRIGSVGDPSSVPRADN
jgi:Tol biopolymer transport system component